VAYGRLSKNFADDQNQAVITLYSRTNVLCSWLKIWGYHGGEVSSRGLLCCDTV